jgi:hypothetical protein
VETNDKTCGVTTPPSDQITARIDENLQLYPQKARSSDLVDLQREFQEMRKQLKDLLIALTAYPSSYTQMNQGRLEVRAGRKVSNYSLRSVNRKTAACLTVSLCFTLIKLDFGETYSPHQQVADCRPG